MGSSVSLSIIAKQYGLGMKYRLMTSWLISKDS